MDSPVKKGALDLFLILFAIIVIVVGFQGNVGTLLAAIFAPGTLTSPPDQTPLVYSPITPQTVTGVHPTTTAQNQTSIGTMETAYSGGDTSPQGVLP